MKQEHLAQGHAEEHEIETIKQLLAEQLEAFAADAEKSGAPLKRNALFIALVRLSGELVDSTP